MSESGSNAILEEMKKGTWKVDNNMTLIVNRIEGRCYVFKGLKRLKAMKDCRASGDPKNEYFKCHVNDSLDLIQKILIVNPNAVTRGSTTVVQNLKLLREVVNSLGIALPKGKKLEQTYSEVMSLVFYNDYPPVLTSLIELPNEYLDELCNMQCGDTPLEEIRLEPDFFNIFFNSYNKNPSSALQQFATKTVKDVEKILKKVDKDLLFYLSQRGPHTFESEEAAILFFTDDPHCSKTELFKIFTTASNASLYSIPSSSPQNTSDIHPVVVVDEHVSTGSSIDANGDATFDLSPPSSDVDHVAVVPEHESTNGVKRPIETTVNAMEPVRKKPKLESKSKNALLREKRSREVVVPYLVKKLTQIGLELLNQDRIECKLGNLKLSTIDSMCSPEEACQILNIKADDRNAFQYVVRAMNLPLEECKQTYIKKYEYIKGCEGKSCVKLSHIRIKDNEGVGVKKYVLSANQIKMTKKNHSAELISYILSLIESQVADTEERVKKLVEVMIYYSDLSGLRWIELMSEDRNTCGIVPVNNFKDVLKVEYFFKTIVSFICNPMVTHIKTEKVELCKNENNQMCVRIAHSGIITQNSYEKMKPRITPNPPHSLEMPFSEGVNVDEPGKRRKKYLNLKNATVEAKKLVNAAMPLRVLDRQKYNLQRTADIVQPYIAVGLLIHQLIDEVQKIDDDTDKVHNRDDVEKKLKSFQTMFIEKFLSVLKTGGFTFEESWARGLSTKTIGQSAYSMLYFIPFYISRFFEMEDAIAKFSDPSFMIEAVKFYRRYIVEIYIRDDNKLQAVLSFLHGKGKNKNIKNENDMKNESNCDLKEYEQIMVGTVVSRVKDIGVAVKIAGIFPRSKGGFQLSKISQTREYANLISKDTVFTSRNIIPLMMRDLLIYFRKFEVITVNTRQEKLFHLFCCSMGWRIESVISVKGKFDNVASPGSRVGDISFYFITSNKTRQIVMEAETSYHKTRKSKSNTATVTQVENERKEDIVYSMIEWFQLRGLFVIDIKEDPKFLHPDALKIKEGIKNQQIFCKISPTGKLIPNQSLSHSTVKKYIRNLAKELNIPNDQLSHRMYRKGHACDRAHDAMMQYGRLTTLREISAVLTSSGLWTGESAMAYIKTRDNNLLKTLQKFRTIRTLDGSATPDDVHQYITDNSLGADYIQVDHGIVEDIYNLYTPVWFPSGPTKNEKTARPRQIADAINSFISDNTVINIQNESMETLNPRKQKFDFVQTFNCYNDSSCFVEDSGGRKCTVSGCDFFGADGKASASRFTFQ